MISILLWYISFCLIIWLVVALLLRPEILLCLGSLIIALLLFLFLTVYLPSQTTP